MDEIQINVSTNLQQSYLQVRRGEIDYDMSGLPSQTHADLARRFGVNRGRYFVHPTSGVNYLALNTSRPLFKDVNLRKAVNFALDRASIARQSGYLGATPTDQVSPPTIRGFRDARLYPLNHPNLARARKLAAGHGGTATLYIGANDPAAARQAEIIRTNLGKIGIKLDLKPWEYAVLFSKAGTLGEPYDMILFGWQADYPDPYDFLNILL